MVCSPSFEPLAANTMSGLTSWKSAIASRSSQAARSGYRCHSTRESSAANASRQELGGGTADSLVFSRTATSTCGE